MVFDMLSVLLYVYVYDMGLDMFLVFFYVGVSFVGVVEFDGMLCVDGVVYWLVGYFVVVLCMVEYQFMVLFVLDVIVVGVVSLVVVFVVLVVDDLVGVVWILVDDFILFVC